jgi:hypothetical protein
MAVPLKMPIAGEVVETNATFAAADEPGRLPDGDDWLFRVRATEPLEEVSGLVNAEGTLAWYADRLRTVKHAILESLSGPEGSTVGPALADGGVRLSSLERVLGPKAFEELIAAIAHG